MPASQAGRRGFEPRLSLHVFMHLQEIEIPSILSIKRLSHFQFSRRADNSERLLQLPLRIYDDRAVPRNGLRKKINVSRLRW